MSTYYRGVTLPNSKVKWSLPPTAWQKDAFAGVDGEIYSNLGKRGCQITVEGILRDVSGATYLPSMAMLRKLDNGTEGYLQISGYDQKVNALIDGIEFGEFVTYPDPSSNTGTMKAARYTINFYDLGWAAVQTESL
jgi:hypothetical protein